MNRVFKLKVSIALFVILFFQAELRAQSVSQVDTSHVLAMNIDTNITKKPSSSIVVKADTALIVKAGATIVQKADTTMVINADPELIRKFNEIVAKQQAEQTKQTNNVTNNNATPAKTDSASKQNTFTEVKTNTPPATQSDNSALPAASSSVPVSVVNNVSNTSATVTGAATPAVTGAAKTDASIPSQSNSNNPSATNNNSQPANNTNPNPVANNTPANKPDSVVNQQPAQNNPSQQTAFNSNTVQSNTVQSNKSDSTVRQQSGKNNVSQQASNSNAVQPSPTASDANNSIQQTAINNTPAAKTDSALTVISDTTKAKTDTVKKSDTTRMKKDTSLMVTDTTQHINKAVAAYLEVGGAGLAISGNYDARFHEQRDGWGYRIGAGYFASGGNTVFTVPFQINYLTGEHSMHIELGAGTTFMNSTGTNIGNSKWEFDKITGFVATATVGFRYQPEQKGLNFRIAFVPILYDEGVIPAGGVSIGYTFK